MLEFLTKAIPFITKLFAVTLGGIIGLMLSGDIKLSEDGKKADLRLNLYVTVKIACSIGLGLFLGNFTVEYFGWGHLSYYSQAVFYMLWSIFGLTIVGTLYRTWQLTTSDKTLYEIVVEIKKVIKAFLQ